MAKITKEQREKWAKEKGYKSFADYQRKNIEKYNDSLAQYQQQWAKSKGFNREIDYRNALAKEKGYKNYSEMLKARRKEKGVVLKTKIPNGFQKQIDYLNFLAQKKGYESHNEYLKSKRKKNDNQGLKRQGLSKLITGLLNETGKNQLWLAEQVGISAQSISMYVHAEVYPKKEIVDKIYLAFENKLLEDIR